MRLTQPQAVALAHWTPGVAACRPLYVDGPTFGSVRALAARRLLAECHGMWWYLLTPAGCSALAVVIAVERIVIPAGCVRLHSDTDDCGLGCWVIALCRVGMSRLEGGAPPHVVTAALAWAPTAEEWAMGRAERDATEGGAAMSRAR